MKTYCGYVAIIGRPNVGKSTLLNTILGEKISITAQKPQTTRHRILGIKTIANKQILYIDTPGLHKPKQRALSRFMNLEALNALDDVDVILFVIEAKGWQEEDELVLREIKKINVPIVLIINKIDTIKNKRQLLPFIQELNAKHKFAQLIPISAKKNISIAALELAIAELLPAGDFLYPKEQLTDKSVKFLAAEIIREKITRLLGQELPYAVTVEIEKFHEEKNITKIYALIYVEKEGQKKIIIGAKGAKLKEIGSKARVDIEKLLDAKVYLQLWVKVKPGWTTDERVLVKLL